MTKRFISDLHFGHDNIIVFDNRPFSGVEQMEETIIGNWNSVVKNDDTTYILGDFCWSAKEYEWCRLLDLLNGNKVLISGNHDLKQMSKILRNRFADVQDYSEIACDQRHVILCHYPILFHKAGYNPDCIMLCGHIHTTRENDFLNKWCGELKETRAERGDACGNIYNVGCMLSYMDYTPQTLDTIINGATKQRNEL